MPRPENLMTDEHRDKPDLTSGISEADLADGALLVGRVGDEEVVLARCGPEIFAIGASCTHYGGPLGEDCWSGTRCAVRGITPASACAPVRRWRRLP